MGGVIGLCFRFFLEDSFRGFSTGVIFLGYGYSLVFFFPSARIEKVWNHHVKDFIQSIFFHHQKVGIIVLPMENISKFAS
jgi:hypothetical protein